MRLKSFAIGKWSIYSKTGEGRQTLIRPVYKILVRIIKAKPPDPMPGVCYGHHIAYPLYVGKKFPQFGNTMLPIN